MTIQKVNSVRVHYGPREVEDKSPSKLNTAGSIQELVVPINYDNLPASEADDATVLVVPAGAVLVSATLVVEEDFVSTSTTTTLNIGLSGLDGTPIDADGIDAAVAADGLVAGTVVLCNGADIGTIPSLTVDGQVVVTPSVADLESGKAKLVIEYRV